MSLQALIDVRKEASDAITDLKPLQQFLQKGSTENNVYARGLGALERIFMTAHNAILAGVSDDTSAS